MKEMFRSWTAQGESKLERAGGFRLYAAMVFVVMFLAYDLQVSRMGFYYDDWEGIFMYKQGFSFLQIWEYFLIDRPFSTLVHVLYNPLLGGSSLAWHIFGLVLNWLAIVFFIKTLLAIWPAHVMHIGWIGMLAAVYPGLTRQFIVKTSMPHFTSMLLFTFSLYLMVLAFQEPRRRWLRVTAAVLMGCVQVLLIEYFSSLELMRFFILFYLAYTEEPSFGLAFRRVVKFYIPFVLTVILFGYYKFMLLPAIQMEGFSAKHAVGVFEQFSTDFAGTLALYTNNILQDVLYAIIYVWTTSIIPQDLAVNARATVLSWVLGCVVAFLAAVAIEVWVRTIKHPKTQIRFPVLVAALPLISIFVGGLPAWSIGRQALAGLWSGRFLLGLFFGAVSILTLVLLWFMRNERRFTQHLALALFLVSAFSLQFRTANKYALNWSAQRDFFWQLKWRAPSLATGAFIVSPFSPLALNVDYQLAFSINMLYGATPGRTEVDYWWFNGMEQLPAYKTSKVDSDRDVFTQFRTISFSSDMQRAVPVLYRPSRGCLLVADRIYSSAPVLVAEEQQMFTTTHPEMIGFTEETPVPTDVFGGEPVHTWCYYFQKADLARQYGEWETVLKLWKNAQGLGYGPGYGPEFIPFIEAFVRTGDVDAAMQLTDRAFSITEGMEPVLCENWKRFAATLELASAWQAVSSKLACLP